MIAIRYNNVNAYVEGDLLEIAEISKMLTWTDKGARFTSAYKKGRWSGKRTVWSVKYQMFPTGLLDAVVHNLRKLRIQVMVQDIREKPNIDIHEVQMHDGLELWEHQQKAVDAFDASNGRGIIKLATRSGKTVIAGAIIQKLGLPSLFITPGKSLMDQTVKEFERKFGLECGRCGDGKWELDAPVVVGIVNSLSNQIGKDGDKALDIARLYERVQVAVFDECHLSSDSYQKISRSLKKAYYRVGLSATPLDGDKGQRLQTVGMTGPIIFSVETEEMVQKGAIARPEVLFIQNESLVPYCQDWDQEYYIGIVANDDRNLKVCIAAVKLVKRRQMSVLMLVQSLEHGTRLLGLLRDKRPDVKTDYVHGEHSLERRKEALFQLQTGTLDVLIASNIFNQGIDIPLLDAVVIAGGYRAPILTKQRYGRPITKAGEKESGLIVDFFDTGGRWLQKHSEERMRVCENDKAFTVRVIELKDL